MGEINQKPRRQVAICPSCTTEGTNTMTKDQIHHLKMALFLAQYFVEEHYGDFIDSEQAKTDNERVILAREILEQLETEAT
jgi:hypothetical protein